jgi:hypothetical protein
MKKNPTQENVHSIVRVETKLSVKVMRFIHQNQAVVPMEETVVHLAVVVVLAVQVAVVAIVLVVALAAHLALIVLKVKSLKQKKKKIKMSLKIYVAWK